MREIMEQDKNNSFTHIVHATGSAGTQSGILTGKKYFNSNVNIIGISVRNNKETQENKVFQLANETCNYLKCKIVNRNEVVVFDEYIGRGYGIPTEGMKKVIISMMIFPNKSLMRILLINAQPIFIRLHHAKEVVLLEKILEVGYKL